MSNFLWPMDCSLPGSSVHRISQATIPEYVEPLGKLHFKKAPLGHFRMSKTWTQTGPSITFLWVSDWYHSSDCSWQKNSKTFGNYPLPHSQYLIHHQVLSILPLKHLSNHLLLCSIITILKGLSFHAVSWDCLHQLPF